MNIILAADHAGFEMKEQLKVWLLGQGHAVEDCGAYTLVSDDDYPVYMHKAAEQLQLYARDTEFLELCVIVLGGSGTGEAIVMNRYSGIRAVVYNGQDVEVIRLGRAHNNANVLSVGARFVSQDQLWAGVQLFLDTPFDGVRHQRRINMIEIVHA